MALGLVLRQLNLTERPISAEEIATISFSLGHSPRDLPIEELMDWRKVAQIWQLDNRTDWAQTIARTLQDHYHPPLYHFFAHWWQKLFVADGDFTSLWVMRSFSVLCGTLAIPCTAFASYRIFKSLSVAQITASLLAVSPYGVYLSQQAAPFALATIWGVLSITSFIVCTRKIGYSQPLSALDIVLWTGWNYAGMATHYFSAYLLLGEAIVAAFLWIYPAPEKRALKGYRQNAIALQTIAALNIPVIAGGMWLFARQYGDWGWNVGDLPRRLLVPIVRAIDTAIGSFILSPLAVDNWLSRFIVAIVAIGFIRWYLPQMRQGMEWWLNVRKGTTTIFLPIFIAAATTAVAIVGAWIWGGDWVWYANYFFGSFICAMLIEGALILAIKRSVDGDTGRRSRAVGFILAILGTCAVLGNFAYPNSDRSVTLFRELAIPADRPLTIVTIAPRDRITVVDPSDQGAKIGRIHSQSELAAIAWTMPPKERQRTDIRFLLASPTNPNCRDIDTDNCPIVLAPSLTTSSTPTPQDVWIVNPVKLIVMPDNCQIQTHSSQTSHPKFAYQTYQCN